MCMKYFISTFRVSSRRSTDFHLQTWALLNILILVTWNKTKDKQSRSMLYTFITLSLLLSKKQQQISLKAINSRLEAVCRTVRFQFSIFFYKLILGKTQSFLKIKFRREKQKQERKKKGSLWKGFLSLIWKVFYFACYFKTYLKTPRLRQRAHTLAPPVTLEVDGRLDGWRDYQFIPKDKQIRNKKKQDNRRRRIIVVT